MKKIILSFILREVKKYFGFLLTRGYSIRNPEYYPDVNGNWAVDFISTDCCIEVSSDRDVINVSFLPTSEYKPEIRFSIEFMIYFLTNGKDIIGDFEGNYAWNEKKQFARMASLLKQNIEKIEPYFGSNFERYKFDLMIAQRKFNDLLLERYVRRHNR